MDLENLITQIPGEAEGKMHDNPNGNYGKMLSLVERAWEAKVLSWWFHL